MPEYYSSQGAPLSPSANQRAASEHGDMSDFWHKMSCCVIAKPPPKRKRRRIDRSMIGEPTNFIHLTHIGSGDAAEAVQPMGLVQDQIRAKGLNGRSSLL
ncbi:CDC42 small effector protein 1 [Periophthalmus magnuspinnatus]|uniref:CDC42 small effector protein 1 n=1 Tax=Periophthalmus magnuspinnatus TaxID=409849 RepID=UPI00145ABB4D|nr:CDC42 small effector protein 1 [Periophthalmus magnuspinnatus]